jgi:hypothetical protein
VIDLERHVRMGPPCGERPPGAAHPGREGRLGTGRW